MIPNERIIMNRYCDDSLRYQTDYSLYEDECTSIGESELNVDYVSESCDDTLQDNASRFSRAHVQTDTEMSGLDEVWETSDSLKNKDLDRNRGQPRKQKYSHEKPPPGRVSDVTSASFSSAHDSCPPEVKEVYAELNEINLKLKEEYRILQERTATLGEREKRQSDAELRLQTTIEEQVQQRIGLRQQELELEIERLESSLREKSKDNRRLQENFNTLKLANDALRKEVETVQSQHDRLEKQSQSVQARLTNLQRKQEHEDRKEVATASETTKVKAKRPVKDRSSKSKCLAGSEVMGSLLEWVSEFHLRLAISDQPSKQQPCPPDFIPQKCFKLVPQLVEALKEDGGQSTHFIQPCLQFLYWALLHLDQASQKSGLSASLRRLGEELYRPRLSHTPEGGQRAPETLYFRSTSLPVRFLSSLICLQTLSAVDQLAHVFDVLRSDLKSEAGKQLFTHYQATPVILHHVRPLNKALMHAALDIFLQLSMENEQLNAFLDSCSCEAWFRAVSSVWRAHTNDQRVQEKLSIVLQKLSKIKGNRKYFEVLGLTTSCQELVRTLNSDQDAAFLILNLKSILFNLNSIGASTGTKPTV